MGSILGTAVSDVCIEELSFHCIRLHLKPTNLVAQSRGKRQPSTCIFYCVKMAEQGEEVSSISRLINDVFERLTGSYFD